LIHRFSIVNAFSTESGGTASRAPAPTRDGRGTDITSSITTDKSSIAEMYLGERLAAAQQRLGVDGKLPALATLERCGNAHLDATHGACAAYLCRCFQPRGVQTINLRKRWPRSSEREFIGSVSCCGPSRHCKRFRYRHKISILRDSTSCRLLRSVPGFVAVVDKAHGPNKTSPLLGSNAS
jgi:hypothetical protein